MVKCPKRMEKSRLTTMSVVSPRGTAGGHTAARRAALPSYLAHQHARANESSEAAHTAYHPKNCACRPEMVQQDRSRRRTAAARRCGPSTSTHYHPSVPGVTTAGAAPRRLV